MVEAREREPRLVPEEHQIRLDREALLHHATDVIDDAVEGAVREHQEPDPVELARGPEGEEFGLDLVKWNRPIHRVLVERVRVEVGDFGAGEHQPVVVRLVTVAVHEDDVPRREQSLGDDLVGCRRPVRDEVGLSGAKGVGCQLLSLPQWADWLEQGVEAPGGCRGLGQEDVQTVEADHEACPPGCRARDARPPRRSSRAAPRSGTTVHGKNSSTARSPYREARSLTAASRSVNRRRSGS